MSDECGFVVDPDDSNPGAGLESTWSCPRAVHGDADRCLFHMSATQRRERGIDPETVREEFVDVLLGNDGETKELLGARLGTLDLSYLEVDGDDKRPVDLRKAEIEELSLEHATVGLPLHLQGASLASVDLDNAVLRKALRVSGGTIGAVDAFEATFEGDADFDEVAFEGEASFVETTFAEDVTFEGSVFEGDADFRGGEFSGGARLLDDNASFADVSFEGAAAFEHATFEHCTFRAASVAGRADFQEAEFGGDVDFRDVVFQGEADFDEVHFDDDTNFDGARFEGPAVFRGLEATGGAAVLSEDLTFDDAVFAGDVDFRKSSFAFLDLEGARIAGHAMFEESVFSRDAVFRDVVFEGEVDFDEVRFDGDADFTGTRFGGPAVFRGAEFTGQANHLQDNVTFADALFEGTADFDNCSFTSANFVGTTFGGAVDFEGSTFADAVDFAAMAAGEDAYVDLTDAHVAAGQFAQPADGWIRYDFTRATLGDVRLTGEVGDPTLLDYFRICETTFEGFDFTAHREHLERNDWAIHEYAPAENADVEYALDLSPATLETTYLRAASAAKEQGARDAAMEFSIKKAYYRRQKNLGYVRDGRLPAGTRVRKVGEVAGNFAWHQVCGYGYRLGRVLATSLLVVLLWGVMFAFLSDPESGSEAEVGTTIEGLAGVDQLATAEGWMIVVRHVYYSLITFTTVGYGDVNPLGPVARGLAAAEGVLGVLLAALVVFVLGRRVAL